MRLSLLAFAVCFLLLSSSTSSVFADAEKEAGIYQEIRNLSKKIEDIKKQDQTILQNQTQILQELQVLKVRVRRS